METFTAIFTQLGVDSSLVPQFIIILGAFVIAQFLFLGKLQSVLETREEKTIKLETTADETIEKVQKMQVDYRLKIDEVNRSTLKFATEKKNKIIQKYSEQYKITEKEVGSFVDESRNEFAKEVEMNKEKYLSEADALSKSLVQKIIQ
jgi:hypothetical protein